MFLKDGRLSTRAATLVEVLSSPTSFARLRCRPRRWTPPVTFRCPVEQSEPGFSILGSLLSGRWNDANHLARGYPLDVVAGTDTVRSAILLGRVTWYLDVTFAISISIT